jgi:hypothetical protein
VPKYILAVLLTALPMMSEQLKVDHITVAGTDLRAMQRALEAAGLPSENGGPHSNHATEMALTSFPDGSYLELIAIQPQADPAAVAAHPWSTFLKENAGPCAWAVRPANMAAEVQRLHAAPPIRNGRKRLDGVKLEWETAQVGPGNGTFFPFLIHDFTPRDLRAYPGGKPTVPNFTGVAKVFLARLAWFKGTPVVLATPLDAQSWLAQRIERFGEAPCAFVLGQSKPAKKITWLDAEKLGWHLGLE